MTIRVECEVKDRIPEGQLSVFQGNLKTLRLTSFDYTEEESTLAPNDSFCGPAPEAESMLEATALQMELL